MHGCYRLFQLINNFIGTHALGQKLFQHGLCLDALCSLSSRRFSSGLLCRHQFSQFFVELLCGSLLAFQFFPQLFDIAATAAISSAAASFSACFCAISAA